VKIPVVLVRGNHDFWDAQDRKDKHSGRRSFGELQNIHRELLTKHEIHHLESGPKVIEDVIICGWDGWYGSSNPFTNDAEHMFRDVEGCPMHVFMSDRAWRQFENVLNLDIEPYRAAIAVTHFNPYCTDHKWLDMCANVKFYDMVKEKFDVFCCGHNHQRKDRIEDGCRVLNSGSDYNHPKYLLFEV
jgi:predicted phosphodiesterase